MMSVGEQFQRVQGILNVTELYSATVNAMRNIHTEVIKMDRMIIMTEREYWMMQHKAKQSEIDAVDQVYLSEAGAHRLALDVAVINLLIHGARAEDVLRDCVGIRIGGDV